MSEVKLLPCPFCGELPVITKHFKHEMYSFVHRCAVIGPISRDFREHAQDHIDMWNTRVQDSSLDAQRQRADKAEAELRREKEFHAVNVSESERKLAAAEQRIAELLAAFTPLIKNWDDLATGESLNVDRARAALNQKSEGESQ